MSDHYQRRVRADMHRHQSCVSFLSSQLLSLSPALRCFPCWTQQRGSTTKCLRRPHGAREHTLFVGYGGSSVVAVAGGSRKQVHMCRTGTYTTTPAERLACHEVRNLCTPCTTAVGLLCQLTCRIVWVEPSAKGSWRLCLFDDLTVQCVLLFSQVAAAWWLHPCLIESWRWEQL